ncbi:hypothetical protein JCM11251_001916 [Rhodosporidiobolus azoricus]
MEHNEAQDIVEWVLYHISQGVDHFIVYDHFSTDATRELLRPFTDLGWVTFVPFNHEGRWAQPAAFEKFTSDWANLSKWLFFFDIDEFIVRNETLLASTGELDIPFATWFDHKYSSYGGVAIGRMSFSSNGHYSPPPEGTLAGFTETRVIDRNFWVPKIVSQAKYKKKGGDIHRQEFEGGRGFVDALEKGGESMWEDAKSGAGGYPVTISHFWAQSWDQCIAKIKQTAFPGSWREKMGEKFCRQEMINTDEYDKVEHFQDLTLARYAPLLRQAKERFQTLYPPFDLTDYTLSLLPSASSSPSRRTPFASTDRLLPPGQTFLLEYFRGPIGHLSVVISTSSTHRSLPLTYHPNGSSVSFSLPPLAHLDPGTGNHELSITLSHPLLPSPTEAPVDPCSIMSHLRNRAEVVQLQELARGRCAGIDPSRAWGLNVDTAAHSHYRGETIFRRFFKIEGAAALPPPPSPASSLSSSSSTPLPLSSLARGRWVKTSLMDYPGGPITASRRLYITERCPARFLPSYWNAQCGNASSFYNPNGGVHRWVPDGMKTYQDLAIPPDDLRRCLAAPGSGSAEQKPRKILLVGDSVASHTYTALQCMLDQIPGTRADDHLRYSSFEYEALNVAGVLAPLSAEQWLEKVAWEWDERAGTPKSLPDVVVLNIGLWAVSWAEAARYEAGLEEGLKTLKEAIQATSRGTATQLVWRETTAVHPTVEGDDPLHQTTPRVELFNEIADRVLKKVGGIVKVPAYGMTSGIAQGYSKDAAHLCPPVQGDMAEVLMRALCDHVLR